MLSITSILSSNDKKLLKCTLIIAFSVTAKRITVPAFKSY